MISKIKVDQLRSNIQARIYRDCYVILPSSISQGQLANEMKSCIENAIRMGLIGAFDELLNNLYTQDDFEDDIDLK